MARNTEHGSPTVQPERANSCPKRLDVAEALPLSKGATHQLPGGVRDARTEGFRIDAWRISQRIPFSWLVLIGLLSGCHERSWNCFYLQHSS